MKISKNNFIFGFEKPQTCSQTWQLIMNMKSSRLRIYFQSCGKMWIKNCLKNPFWKEFEWERKTFLLIQPPKWFMDVSFVFCLNGLDCRGNVHVDKDEAVFGPKEMLTLFKKKFLFLFKLAEMIEFWVDQEGIWRR